MLNTLQKCSAPLQDCFGGTADHHGEFAFLQCRRCIVFFMSYQVSFLDLVFTRGSTESLHVHPSEDGATFLGCYAKLWRYTDDKKSCELI